MNREEILEEVKKIVCTRQEQHGDPENTFWKIAFFWTNYLGMRFNKNIAVGPEDVAMMMVLFKVARQVNNPKNMDNYLDIAGYAAVCGEIVDKENN